MVPSDRFKDAFKLALAMVITYGIALSLNWEKPFWAGLSVAFCSLATAGESINRGIHRIAGTLLAGVVTLTLMALFPQERWLFLLAMSAFIALCTYRLSSGSRYFFIWFATGFTIPILAMLGEGLGLNSFNVVILRVQETALGVIVYSLVAILLWPQRGGADFENAVRAVCDAQHQLFRRYFRSMTGTPDDGGAVQIRSWLAGQLARLGGRLEGAMYDSDEIWQARQAWRRCLGELSALSTAMERWRLGFDELRDLDLQRLMPGLTAFGDGLETRLRAIDAMLAGQPPSPLHGAVDLQPDRDALHALTHFQRAAVLLCRDQLLQIDRLTHALFDTISGIRGHGRAGVPVPASAPTSPPRVIDSDRLAATVRQSAALWMTLLMAIYTPAFPNVVGVVALTNAFAMILSTVPHIQPVVLLLPTVTGTVLGGILYLFLMPHLSGFGELGVMIFAVTFLIAYVFHRPQAAVVKSMWLCMLVIVLGVENHQNYNFLYFANWFIAGVFFVLTLMVAWRFPISYRPEDRFLAMLGRFFRSAGFLLSTFRGDASRKASWLFLWRRAFHRHEVMVLPQRLRAWGGSLPPAALGNTGPEQIQSLLNSLQALSDRIQPLLDAESAARPGTRERELLVAMRDWQDRVEEAFRRLMADPGSVDHLAFRSRLEAMLARFEGYIGEALDKTGETGLSAGEGGNMYLLLGAYRGVSEALVDLARQVSPIDWARLREARF
jgi:uncharacterized membrane protein YccC